MGAVELLSLTSPEAQAIAKVMRKIDHLRPQLADRAVVYRADRDGMDTIFILDQRDFSEYAPDASGHSGSCRFVNAQLEARYTQTNDA